MNDEELIKLIKFKEQAVLGVLIVNDLVEIIQDSDGFTIENIKPTELGKSILGNSIYFTDEWIKALRLKWDSKLRGNPHVIRDKCEKFISRTGASLEDIEKVVDQWLLERKPPYCGKMENFFYKKDDEGRIVSQAEDIYESLSQEQDDPRFQQA